jgi:hypothetical protein
MQLLDSPISRSQPSLAANRVKLRFEQTIFDMIRAVVPYPNLC